MKTLLLLTNRIFTFSPLFILSLGYVHGQNLLDSRKTSFYTYYYQMSNEEAEILFKGEDPELEHHNYFHTLVDSTLTDSLSDISLREGHYLKVFVEESNLKFDLLTMINYDVRVLNNSSDLQIKVYDSLGQIINHANVIIKNRKVPFDKKTSSYLIKKTNKKGFVKVQMDEMISYHHLDRQYDNSWFRRSSRKVLYKTPIKFIVIPTAFIISLPIDGVKSIIHGYTYGTIHTVKRFFVNSYESIACLFDDYYCNDYNIEDQYKSFLVFNKPKYRPKDTVRFKAYVVNKKGKPIKDYIHIVFKKAYNKEVPILNYTHYRPGGLSGEFVLSDSLEIELDKYYYVELLNDKEQKVLSNSFKYEDYELGKLHLNLTTEGKQFRGQPFEVSISGKDENDLNILDGRLEITLKLNETIDFFRDQVFVPDTLFHKSIPLEPDQETKLQIPDSLFPAANLNYNIGVKLLTSDNETLNSSKNIDYYHSNEEIEYELDQDSITVFYTKNGIRQEKNVRMSGVDGHGNEFGSQSIQLPFKDRINNYYSKYLVQTDSIQKYLFLNNDSPNLQLYSNRTYDSLFIEVSNPRDIPFTYFIYKNNHEIERGYGTTLKHSRKVNTKSNYYVSLQYLWAGEVKEDNYEINYDKTKLKIEVDHPQLAYPGQKVPVSITVKDHKGRPVPNVDLTAYGLTKKFNYSAPTVPDFYKNKKHRATINTFSLKNASISNAINLPFDQWESIATLDTIEYFDLIYPGDSIYRFSYETPDSNTQFAPYVLHDGNFVPVRMIYLDNRPVYFNWMSMEQPYSFPAIYGLHEVKIRTMDKLITIKKIHFEYGQKHIFSLNDDLKSKNVTIQEMSKSFTEHEKNTLSRYIMAYRRINSNNLAYLRQGNQVHLLNTATSGNYYNPSNYLIGPVYPQKVHFKIMDSYDLDFPYESGFEYEFQSRILKMRSVEKSSLFYDRSYYARSAVKALDELYMTEHKAIERWQHILDKRRRNNLYNRYNYSTDHGRIKIELTHSYDSFDILNTALIKKNDSDFLRLYSGFPTSYDGLEAGLYQLIVFSSDEKYAVLDSLEARKNGLNFYKINGFTINEEDSFSIKINRLIQNMAIRNEFLYVQEHDKNEFLNTYREKYTYYGEGNTIQGRVFGEDGDPLPGVNVIVKGTTYGTVTNIDGYYSIKAPYDAKLVFSFIGFVQNEVEVGNKNQIDQMLTPDVQQLSEVVVVGYSTQRKSNITGSVSTVQGRAAGVMIRGVNSAQPGSSPLLIIDGKPYMGSMDDLDESLIADMEVIHDSSATAIYGSRAANGVVIIDTKGGTRFKKPSSKGMPIDETFMENAMQASSIRNNFSDYAFWQPQLVTDENGEARFETPLPDDVTNWSAYVLAINDQQQSGQMQSEIKSFKPVMAQINLPRFLTVGDSSLAIGKSLNYTPDSIDVSTHFELNGKERFTYEKSILHSDIDSLKISPINTDTLKAKYYLKKSDGYFDGEEREIPVFPVGLESTVGQFFVLDKDTTLNLDFVDSLGDVHIYAHANEIDVLQEEINRLVDYPYACNEQMASRLMGLLAQKMIQESQGADFDKEGDVKKLIKKLLKNQNAEGLWGWWNQSQSLEWVSEQVVEALMLAKENGYNVDLNLVNIEEHLIWKLESVKGISNRLKYLRIAKLLEIENIDYNRYINAIDTVKKKSALENFQLIALKQAFDLPYSLDSIMQYQNHTLFGNIYFEDDREDYFHFWTRPSVLTLYAYQILKNDSLDHSPILRKIRHYFLENKGRGCFINTYETARIVHTILPDMLKGSKEIAPPELVIEGSLTKTVKSFPFDTTLTAESQISIRKKGGYPVYFTAYQRYWNTSPKPYADQFEIDTHFENDSDSLKAGEAVKLMVTVNMEKEAEYLVIEVPIPAGCSYETKNQSYKEVHREYFRNKVGICLRSLPKGEHTFTIDLMPRYSGKYTLNPAKVEMMYFPTFYSNNGLKKVGIW